jgi:hypothetical protein
MTAPAASRGWAVCLATLASMLHTISTAEQGQERDVLGSVSVCRSLLDEVLPVLMHVASHECVVSSSSQGIHDTPGRHILLQPSAAQPGAAVSADPPAIPVSSGSGPTISVPPATVHTVPVESTLLLLGASAKLLRRCVPLAFVNKDAYSTLSRSLHAATQTASQDDLVAALGAVLALASDLVGGGPWWQQAKAHYPLALIEALFNTSVVRGGLVPT